MTGFIFEATINKRINVIKDSVMMQSREDLLQDWAQEVEGHAKKLAARPTGYPDHARGRRTGKLVDSINISGMVLSPTHKTMRIDVDVNELKTWTEAGPYSCFIEYGTGLWTEYPGHSPRMIFPKNRKRMTWIEYGKPYRGKMIKAHSVADFETKRRARPILAKRYPGGAKWDRGGKPRPFVGTTSQEITARGRGNRYQTTYNRRKAGGPWQQIAEGVKGVKPRHYMRDTLIWTKSTLNKRFAVVRDALLRGIKMELFDRPY